MSESFPQPNHEIVLVLCYLSRSFFFSHVSPPLWTPLMAWCYSCRDVYKSLLGCPAVIWRVVFATCSCHQQQNHFRSATNYASAPTCCGPSTSPWLVNLSPDVPVERILSCVRRGSPQLRQRIDWTRLMSIISAYPQVIYGHFPPCKTSAALCFNDVLEPSWAEIVSAMCQSNFYLTVALKLKLVCTVWFWL